MKKPRKPAGDRHAIPPDEAKRNLDDYQQVQAVIKTKKKPTGAAALGAGPGRPKGMQNKVTVALKEAILEAGERAGGKDGMIGYLTTLAMENSSAYASLLGKVLPNTLEGPGNSGEFIHRIVREIVDPKET